MFAFQAPAQHHRMRALVNRGFTPRSIEKLRPEDRIAIVTYANSSGVALPSTTGAKKGDMVHNA